MCIRDRNEKEYFVLVSMALTPEAAHSVRCAKICWVILHLLILVILVTQETPLKYAIIVGDWTVIFSSLFLVLTTIALYFQTGIDPGYLRKKEDELDHLGTDHDDRTHILIPNEDDDGNHFCKECNIQQPLRTKHCNKCDRCVLRFDHHCFFIGNCVGMNNHRVFMWYLLSQTITILWGLILSFNGFQKTKGKEDWFELNLVILVVTMILLIFFFLPFGLLIFHVYLMITNQTTWETTKRQRISYLKDLSESTFPFDEGIMRNTYLFCCVYSTKSKWIIPKDIEERQKKRWNIWNNDYYECC
eukprot:TRINITY_DN2666_c0_g1_i1.p1 TRINITY_DN2666_c0_g1~~TRINITY_DN2666_c0_g1_i1.p1  ORF type:complete len:302 (-),score=41.74 TRINITY_DN2666_c0_g1_i1:22-927(-)